MTGDAWSQVGSRKPIDMGARSSSCSRYLLILYMRLSFSSPRLSVFVMATKVGFSSRLPAASSR